MIYALHMATFYLTTTLPYVNAKPHIGHALEFIQADVITRRRRTQGDEVIFNVGTDEHGLKIYEKAAEADMDVRDFVDMNVKTFTEFCKQFQVNYDSFYRTSDPKHLHVAQAFWKDAKKNGDIYEKTYTGLYCVGCESFKTPKELVDGKCPDHLTEPIPYEEQNYFFRLSTYKDQLLHHITALL
ncbi:MAG: class I tRNA ligase family protein [bacterium]|nr:class I tRNA ligase family protein [bacterium]